MPPRNRKNYRNKDNLRDRYCPICGKLFLVFYDQDWAYSIPRYRVEGRKFFCSYKCYRQYQQMKEHGTLEEFYKSKIKEDEK